MSNPTHTAKPAPRGWPRISSALFYDDAAAAIDWLCRAFGFEVRLRVDGEGGRVEHSELTLGDGLIMVGSTGDRPSHPRLRPYRSPRALDGANTQSLCVYVDDADAHCARARAAGAKILEEPKTSDYGADYWSDRGYCAADPEGHQWYFLHRVRDQATP
ncbi:MAG: VOC family protein [Planctomycetota bacterium]